MAFRLPTSVPQTIPEFWERFREFVRQVEPVVLPNVAVGTTESAHAHGLGEVPAFVAWSAPHCISIVRQTKRATAQAVYLKATNACVVDVYLFRMSQLGMGETPNGGFQLPDWAPPGDHKFSTDATDEVAGGAGYALTKLSSTGNVKPTLDTTSSQRRVRFDLDSTYAATLDDHLVKSSDTDATTVGGLLQKTKGAGYTTLSEVTDGGIKKLQISSSWPSVPSASEAIPLPVGGTGSPGSGSPYSREDHIHPETTHADVYCMYTGYVSCLPSLWDGWTLTGAHEYTRDTNTALEASVCDGILPYAGMRVLAWEDGIDAADKKGAGLWEVINVGGTGVSDYAIMRRTTDADTDAEVYSGMTVKLDAGINHRGQRWRLKTANPITLETTEQEWELCTGTKEHNGLLDRDLDGLDPRAACHPLSATGHKILYLSSDWHCSTTAWERVSALEAYVYSGQTYLVRACLFILDASNEGIKINLDGDCIVGAGEAHINHSFIDAIAAVGSIIPDPGHVYDNQWGTNIGEGQAATSKPSGTSIITWKIDALVHVNGDGYLGIGADTFPYDYNTSYILKKSFIEIQRVA